MCVSHVTTLRKHDCLIIIIFGTAEIFYLQKNVFFFWNHFFFNDARNNRNQQAIFIDFESTVSLTRVGYLSVSLL